jgi:hypothetical protein
LLPVPPGAVCARWRVTGVEVGGVCVICFSRYCTFKSS